MLNTKRTPPPPAKWQIKHNSRGPWAEYCLLDIIICVRVCMRERVCVWRREGKEKKLRDVQPKERRGREKRRGDCLWRITEDVSPSAYTSELVTTLQSSFLWWAHVAFIYQEEFHLCHVMDWTHSDYLFFFFLHIMSLKEEESFALIAWS